MDMLRILVVDDEKISRVSMVKQLQRAGYGAVGCAGAYAALGLMKEQPFDVVITDLRMPTMDGLELLRNIKADAPDTEVMVITAYSSVETAVAAMREGAVDYLTKPFSFSELEVRLERMARILQERNQLRRYQRLAGDADSFHGLVGRSPAMRDVFEKIRVFGPHPAPVLIHGRTGTGKELVARAIHEESGRDPFIAVPCGAIPRDLAESELFGHERGAFTGAFQRQKGKFELAGGGTLFLDDVDDLPLEIQPKLLRVLQERQFARVGGQEILEAEVRVIAASKWDLANLVREGRFREDLYYRLNVMNIDLVPLKERREDILPLARYFLEELAARRGADAKVLSERSSAILLRYDWPGNVRELKAVLESAEAMAGGITLLPRHFPPALLEGPAKERKPFGLSLDAEEKVSLRSLLDQFEYEVIRWALDRASGHQQQAAELLGIPRTTLQSKLARYQEKSR